MALIINELDSDTPGSDTAEFVEIFNTDSTSVSLAGYTLVFYNGSNDQSYFALDLDAFSTNAQGYFVAGNAGVNGVTATFTSNTLQNGQDAVALYLGNASDFPTGTSVRTANLVDAVVYDTSDADDPGLLALLNPGQPQVDENANATGDTQSIARRSNGSGGERNTATFVAQAPTPGASNDPTLSITAADASKAEGNSATTPFTFTVTRSSSAGTASVNYAIAGLGTAAGQAEAEDFAAPTSGTVSFAATETSKTITINVVGDTVAEGAEGAETFSVELSSPVGATLQTATAAGTIQEDDGPPPAFTTVAIDNPSVAEGNPGDTRVLTFSLSRSGGDTSGELVLAYTLGGTATNGGDYTPPSPQTVTFAAGETTAAIAIPIVEDLTIEPSETVTVQLQAGTTGVAFASGGVGTGTIMNDDFTRISAIQGQSHTSPLVGQAVTTQGIVTAIDTNGFYLQEPGTGDGVDATSDALFVFTFGAPADVPGASTISVGDTVEVGGRVTEFRPGGADAPLGLTITQIERVSSSSPLTVAVVTEGSATNLPAAVILGAAGRLPPTQLIGDDDDVFDPATQGLDFYESLEGMRVTINDPVAAAATIPVGGGEIYVFADNGAGATGRSLRGTANIEGDPIGAAGQTTTNVQGGDADFNPEHIQIDVDSGLLSGGVPNVSTGARFSDYTGVVSYSFGFYEVLATEAFTVDRSTEITPETGAFTGTATQITIASYNVLNLDPVVEAQGERDDDVGDGRFGRVAEDIVGRLNLPDILALEEIQDNDGGQNTATIAADQTLQRLVDEVNARSGGVTYAFLDNRFIADDENGGQPGGNIRTAFIYRTDRVEFVPGSDRTILADGTASQALNVNDEADPNDFETTPANPFNDARPPLAADFRFLPTGETVTVVNNHFSSKGGSDPLFGTNQPPVNGEEDIRGAQAFAVNSFVDGLLAANPQAQAIVLGDLNEFEFEEPLQVLEGDLGYDRTTFSVTGTPDDDAGETVLNNLTFTLPPNERYTFNFDGNSQALDHILVTDSLFAGAEFDEVHINSEFTGFRGSDHDPLLARFDLTNLAPTAVAFGNTVPSLAENTNTAARIRLADISVTDDARGTETLSLSGPDAGLFEIVGSQLFLRAGVVLDTEARPSFTVNVDADDPAIGASGSVEASRAFTLAVTDVDEFDVTAPADQNGAANTVAENAAVGTLVGITAQASDADATTNGVSFSLVAPSGEFAIGAATGVVTVAGAIDREAGAARTVTVRATSQDGSIADAAFAVTVANQNDNPPVITSNGAGATAALAVAENQTAVTTVTASDADGTAPTFALAGGADQARFTIDTTTGVLRFVASPDFEAPADAGANNVYDVIVRATDTITVDDQAIAITVTDVNDTPPPPPPPPPQNRPPAAAPDTASALEDGGPVTIAAASLLANDTDPDSGDTKRIVAVAATGVGAVSLDGSGNVVYDPGANFQALNAGESADDTFRYTIADAAGAQASATVTVRVAGANESAPPPPPARSGLTEGDDNLSYGNQVDVIGALAGNDIIRAGGGNDRVDGGDGNDLLFGQDGDDELHGNEGDDRIEGEEGNDRIGGGNGNDRLAGDGGNDTLFGGTGEDTLYGDAGNDELSGENGQDVLEGGTGDDRLFGNDGDDVLRGNDGNDDLQGGDGKDRLEGGNGNDRLAGGVNDDVLHGGSGSDTFVFEASFRSDRIEDFASEDVIELSAGRFSSFASVMARTSQIGGDTLIQDDGGQNLTLQNVSMASLQADDFRFV